jgi:magnesium transporter
MSETLVRTSTLRDVLVDDVLVTDGAVSRDEGPATLERAAPAHGTYQWLCLARPTHDELARLGELFTVHPLALEDAGEEHQRPKLELYDDLALLVVRTVRRVAADQRLRTGEVNVFVGRDFVITVLHGDAAGPAGEPGPPQFWKDLVELWDPDVMRLGPAAAVHAVCDLVVDGYEEVADDLLRASDNLEDAVFDMARDDQITLVHQLRRQLADLTRAVTPLREPLNRIAESPRHPYPPQLTAYLRDVSDHVARLHGTLDHLTELIGSAFDAYAAQISLRQNEDMRKISAGAALVVVPTLIAGVYGMNFRHMPELEWTFGYPLALLLMACSMAGLWIFFKRSGWL